MDCLRITKVFIILFSITLSSFSIAAEPAELIRQLKQSLSGWNAISQSFSLGNVSAHTESGRPTLSGGARLFNSQVNIKAVFNTNAKPHALDISFPASNPSLLQQLTQILGSRAEQFLPDSLGRQINVKNLHIDFSDSGTRIDLAALTFEAPSWRPLPGLALQAGKVTIVIAINKPTGNRVITAALSTPLQLSGMQADLKGQMRANGKDWSLEAHLRNITLQGLMTSLVPGGGFRQLSLPMGVLNMGVNDLRLIIQPQMKQLQVLGSTSLGQIQVNIKGGARKEFLLAFKPPASIRFSSIDSNLSLLDNMQLRNTAIVIASHNQTVDSAILEGVNERLEVGRGMTLMANYRLDSINPQVARLLGQTSILLRTTVSTNPRDLVLEGRLNTNVRLDAKGTVTLKNVTFQLEPKTGNPEISLGGELDLKIDRQILTFNARVGIKPVELGIVAEGTMKGTLSNAFGIKGLHFKDLGIAFGASFRTTPVPLPTVGLKGTLIAGNLSRPDFQGDVSLYINTATPLESVVDAGFNRLSIKQILSAATSRQVYNSIPAGIRNTILNVGIEDARLTVVPSPNGAKVFGKTYDPGFLVRGKATIANLRGELLLAVDYTSGLEARASIDAIRHPPFFEVTGSRGKPNPFLYIIAKPSRNSMVAISGRIKVLGISSESDIYLNDKGFDYFTRGKIFNAFDASLEIAGGDINNGGSFYVMAKMHNDLLNTITRDASRAIDRATRQTRNDMDKAKQDISAEQAKVRRMDVDINRMRSVVRSERRRDCAKHDRAARDIQNEQRKVNSLRSQINSKNNRIRRIKAQVRKNVLGIATPAQSAELAKLSIEVAALETARFTANGALSAAKAAANAASYLCKKTPIDLDPRISSLIAAKETAIGSLEIAKTVVEGAKQIGIGTLQASKWIINNGGKALGVVNITDAKFEGCLSAASGGSVALEISGTFADKPIHGKIHFNLQNPALSIKAIADSLILKGKLPAFRTPPRCQRPAFIGAILAKNGQGQTNPASFITKLPGQSHHSSTRRRPVITETPLLISPTHTRGGSKGTGAQPALHSGGVRSGTPNVPGSGPKPPHLLPPLSRPHASQPRHCGHQNQRACSAREFTQSCTRGLINHKGRCQVRRVTRPKVQPRHCGHQNQRACSAREYTQACSRGLINNRGRCQARRVTRPKVQPRHCGHQNQRACSAREYTQACSRGLINNRGRCQARRVTRPKVQPRHCGHQNQRACSSREYTQACSRGLINNRGRCQARRVTRPKVQPRHCGHQNQRACSAREYTQACTRGLVNRKGRCQVHRISRPKVQPRHCGHQNQRACSAREFTQSCTRGLINHKGRCQVRRITRPKVQPRHCGHQNQRACNAREFTQACTRGLINRKGRCQVRRITRPKVQPRHCGHQNQRACSAREYTQDCTRGLVNRKGRCQVHRISRPKVQPRHCGHQNQRVCNAREFTQACTRGLIINRGRCLKKR